MTSCSTPLASGENDLTSWEACELVWRREWRCTTSVCGSTSSLVVPGWPLPICWDGDLTVHTKRLRVFERQAHGDQGWVSVRRWVREGWHGYVKSDPRRSP